MQVQESIQIASDCINSILSLFENNLVKKKVQTIAQKAATNFTMDVSKQFMRLIGTNNMKNQFKQQLQPLNIRRDTLSCYQTCMEDKLESSKLCLTTQKSTKARSSSNYSKLSSIKQPIKIIRKEFIQLNDLKISQKEDKNSDRMRNIYLMNLKNKLKEEKELEESLMKSKKNKKAFKNILDDRQLFTYNYDGKIMKTKQRSKSFNIVSEIKPKIDKNLRFIKKVEMKKPQQQIVNGSLIQSAYLASRKSSIQIKPQRLFQDLSIRETPVFSTPQSPQRTHQKYLKLNEFMRICRKNKAKQYRFFTQKSNTTELPPINKSMNLNKSIGRENLKTDELVFGASRYKYTEKLKYLSRDRIKVNPQIFQQYMTQI